jgi:hypothetical protein
VLAATPTAVKSAYDLAALALPKAGGTFETTLTVADPTAARTITLPNDTGTVALTSQLDDSTY